MKYLYDGHILPDEFRLNRKSFYEIDNKLRYFIMLCVLHGIETIESCQGEGHSAEFFDYEEYIDQNEPDGYVVFTSRYDPRIRKLLRQVRSHCCIFKVSCVSYSSVDRGIKIAWETKKIETERAVKILTEMLRNSV